MTPAAGGSPSGSLAPASDAAVWAPSPFTPEYQLRCSDVLPIRCDASWRSSRPDDVINSARRHGASVHGFTQAWYDADRLTAMAQQVTS
jgi:hypothetical protein